MTEKTPIEPEHIRTGDLIRAEWEEGQSSRSGDVRAIEYVAARDGDAGYFDPDDMPDVLCLVNRPERPESPVPTQPTFGALRMKDGRILVGSWRTHDYSLRDGIGRAIIQNEREIPVADVQSFTPGMMLVGTMPEDVVSALADVFREEWEAADARGDAGRRTDAGIEAVFAALARKAGL